MMIFSLNSVSNYCEINLPCFLIIYLVYGFYNFNFNLYYYSLGIFLINCTQPDFKVSKSNLKNLPFKWSFITFLFIKLLIYLVLFMSLFKFI